MIKHFLGCLIKDLPLNAIFSVELPEDENSIAELIPPGTYAYFKFDSEIVDNKATRPINVSSVTYLGGAVYTMEEIAKEAIKTGNVPALHVISLPFKSPEELMRIKQFILTKNNTWMPFFEDDLLINIEE